MKNVRPLEQETLALLMGFAIGLAMAVHVVFFGAALAIAIFAIAQTIIERLKLTHRQP